jgi:uroporphyrinogen-III synthase
MPTKDDHTILVTRELSDEQLILAEELSLRVIVEPAIRFDFRHEWYTVTEALESATHPVFAFTSQNGVEGLRRLLQSGYTLPEGVICYAVGGKTAEALASIGIEALVPDLHYGEHLGQKIVEDLGSARLADVAVFHFCGNRRREEMRQVLENSGVEVKDIVVYKTLLNQMPINLEGVEGVLFYSPSAVEAFRKSGGFKTDPLPELFAIGETTGQELSIESGRHIHISPMPDTEQFLKFVKRILSEKPHLI